MIVTGAVTVTAVSMKATTPAAASRPRRARSITPERPCIAYRDRPLTRALFVGVYWNVHWNVHWARSPNRKILIILLQYSGNGRYRPKIVHCVKGNVS
jgi:hypothetical protein